MKRSLLVFAYPLTSLVSLACQDPAIVDPPPAETRTKISLASLVDDGAALQGLAIDPARGTLHVLVERRGILEINVDGELVKERPIGVNGLVDRPYRDLAVAEDGRMVL